ncbi:XRE family transcriptional regulator [Pseudomonas sp. Choline-02u-1]|jgi:phage repressor protein C with HTH and peptisase S24 domain|uniref:S24 family peptidase n=1 Tax=Pseudomonas sp. Choline-02u-1 TaxID=2058307 RepID=UPI000C32078C|nr:S24 family peptidase [Pseudomonas sp. Choline-02u-1]PKH81886.1 XRE family transcriptional regulator [Pseudomonas sp. Choline-02u-1]
MLTGPELGAAIEAARIAKGVSKKQLADDFSVKPPSVQGWVKNGRIDKSKLMDVIAYFSDVVGPSHWGMRPGFTYESLGEGSGNGLVVEEPETGSTAADKFRAMLAGKRLDESKLTKLLAIAENDALDESVGVLVQDAYRPGKVGDEVWIAHYDIRGAMGGGEVNHDYPELLQDVRVSPSQLRAMGVEFKEHFHLKMITGWGQSMAPTIKHGDPLLVDISVKDFIGDGIYFFSYQGFQYIKRLQMKGKDKFKMISDNRKHKAEDIWLEETYIQARVLLVWNANLV